MIHRDINTPESHSFFLFGARGTGKSTLIQQRFSTDRTLLIDLLQPAEEAAFLRNPSLLSERITAAGPALECVVIDEVQKAPKLLDLVHYHIEDTKRRGHPIQFVLTGSSARKLKRGAANLLAGRAFMLELFPLTHRELGHEFDLRTALEYGTLPAIHGYTSPEERRAYLDSYALTYLKEEVWNEQLVRKLEPFAHFLEVAAQSNGKILNYSKIARSVGVDTKTVQAYYQILEDTLVGLRLPAYRGSARKRLNSAPKFYFFDPGVKRALDHTLTVPLNPQTYAFGNAFEHFLILEIARLCSHATNDYRLSYFRTHEGAEVDLVIDRPGRSPVLLEIKSTQSVDIADLQTLERVSKDFGTCECMCLCREDQPRQIGSLRILPWAHGLVELLES